MNYSDLLKHPKWQKKRLEILERDNFTCTLCGDKETQLHVHHKSYYGNLWDIKNIELKTVCKHCHNLIHYVNIGDIYRFKVIKIKYHIIDGASCFFILSKDHFSTYLIDHNDNDRIEEFGIYDKQQLEIICKLYKL